MRKTIKVQIICCAATLLLLFLVSCNKEEPEETDNLVRKTTTVNIQALLQDTDSSYILQDTPHGQAVFREEEKGISLQINLVGFSPNSIHAVHIHEGTCELPGIHWNSGMSDSVSFCNVQSMESQWAKPKAGDVGNVSVGYDGSGIFLLSTDLWTLGDSAETDILGKVLIVHEKLEDFASECAPFHGNHTHGNSKIACGIIQYPDPTEL